MTKATEKRVTRLEDALVRLLDALEKQYYAGRAPGQYSYSLRVNDAMAGARELLKLPPASLEAKDEAHVDWPKAGAS